MCQVSLAIFKHIITTWLNILIGYEANTIKQSRVSEVRNQTIVKLRKALEQCDQRQKTDACQGCWGNNRPKLAFSNEVKGEWSICVDKETR